jgi:putative sterol carrier protein
MLSGGDIDNDKEFIRNLKENFHPIEDFSASYAIIFSDIKKTLVVDIQENRLKCYYGDKPDADVIAKTTREVMNKLVLGRITFQGAFMSGDLTAKGNFKTLRTFDQVFQFNIL